MLHPVQRFSDGGLRPDARLRLSGELPETLSQLDKLVVLDLVGHKCGAEPTAQIPQNPGTYHSPPATLVD